MRRVRGRGRGYDRGVKFALMICSAVAMSAAALSVSYAQEPPPGYVPPTPALFSIPGGFRLAWAPVTGASRYAIRLGVTADDGTFIADDELANIDAGNRTFDIDAVLPHTEPLRCYTMRWRIYALVGTSAPEPPGEHSVRMCTDAGNKAYLPAGASTAIPATGTGPAVVGNRRLTIRFAYVLEIAGTVLVGVAMFRLTRQR